jgi:hypothetical protein
MSGIVRRMVLVAAIAGFGACILSPQPDPPDSNDIFISSSGGPGETEVAVVGRSGAVPGDSRVRVERTEGTQAAETDASDDGSFALVIWARPGEELRISYREPGSEEDSDAANGRVDDYDPSADIGSGGSPYPPGEWNAGGTGVDAPIHVDAPDAGLARVWGDEGAVQPGVRVVVGNQTSGFVRETVYGSGAFELRIPAAAGDVLLVFAVSPERPEESSPVVRLVVPAP